jgi:hypothetical protein
MAAIFESVAVGKEFFASHPAVRICRYRSVTARDEFVAALLDL